VLGKGGKYALEARSVVIDFDLGVGRPLEAEGVAGLHVGKLVQAHGVVPVNCAGK
jgi:hypothetical protein